MDVTGPLEGVRVVEVCDEPGQYAGKLLADMGADVIKVEPPEGSCARRVGPFVGDIPGPNRSLNFWYYNTNKRSVVLDLAGSEPDRARFRRLAAGADIVFEDQGPGRLAGLGLGYEALAADNHRLVMCSLTPFGQDGPWRDYRVSDMVALALGGPMRMCGYSAEDKPGAPPIRGHGDQGYNTACHVALHGVLAALLYAGRTGEGQYVDCAIHEALSCTTEVGVPYYLYRREDVVRQTARHAAGFRTDPWTYACRDGIYVNVYGVGRDNASWKEVKAWFQSEGFGLQFDEPRFDDPPARQQARGSPESREILAEVQRLFALHDAEEVTRRGQKLGQAWGVVRSPEENLKQQHFGERGFFVEVTGEGLERRVAMPGAPYIFSRTPWALRRPAPKLGEHTAEVVAEIDGGGRPNPPA